METRHNQFHVIRHKIYELKVSYTISELMAKLPNRICSWSSAGIDEVFCDCIASYLQVYHKAKRILHFQGPLILFGASALKYPFLGKLSFTGDANFYLKTHEWHPAPCGAQKA